MTVASPLASSARRPLCRSSLLTSNGSTRNRQPSIAEPRRSHRRSDDAGRPSFPCLLQVAGSCGESQAAVAAGAGPAIIVVHELTRTRGAAATASGPAHPHHRPRDSRFQEASYAFDDVAAEILALNRKDLPVMTALLFNGPCVGGRTVGGAAPAAIGGGGDVERLQLAGYARVQPGAASRLELTRTPRQWIERIWAPLREEGERLLDGYSMPHLAMIAASSAGVCASGVADHRLRAWLALPASPARRSHLRGGLSPAALQRVQVFIEANLGDAIHLHDLAARAALSPYHFARAFKTSAGMTPRAFVEQRRIERAKQLLPSRISRSRASRSRPASARRAA